MAVTIYQAGDRLVHPEHGGCIVSGIRAEMREGKRVQYVVLIPQGDTSIRIYAPLDNLAQIGVRELISEQMADRLLESFSAAATEEISADRIKRHRVYQDIVKCGDLERLAELIRELVGNPMLSLNNKELLSRAQNRLFSEIALVKGLDFQKTLQMARSRMSSAPVIA